MKCKKRTLCKLTVTERLQIVKLAVKRSRTQEEIALKFNVKEQLVRDLLKSLKRSKGAFLNKKKAELKQAQERALIGEVIERRLS